MPRFPKNRTENILDKNTPLAPEKKTKDDIVNLELARVAKAKRDNLKSFQLEDQLDALTSDLGAEVEQLHTDNLAHAGDGLTRKALETIDKHFQEKTSNLGEKDKQFLSEGFEARRPELLKHAAHLETEARKKYYTDVLQKHADRLRDKIEQGEDLDLSAFAQLEAKVEKADLPLAEKQEFSNSIAQDIALAQKKAEISQDDEARAKIIEGDMSNAIDESSLGRLKTYALQHERNSLVEEATRTLSQFRDIENRIKKEGVSFEEIKKFIDPLPPHLQSHLKMKTREHEEIAKLASSYRKNPSRKKTGEKLATRLIEGKDIISDKEASDAALGFASRHGVVPNGIGEVLRAASETNDPARLINALNIANQFQKFSPTLFDEDKFYSLKAKNALFEKLKLRFSNEKVLSSYMARIFSPDKPLSVDEITTQHGSWVQEYSSHHDPETRQEFSGHLMRSLTLTNGMREEAIQIAEAMYSKGNNNII